MSREAIPELAAAKLFLTIAFCESLVNDSPVPCTGQDGLAALIMALAADKSAAENRWVSFKEVVQSVYCSDPLNCEIMPMEVFPEGFRMTGDPRDLLLPDVDEQKAGSRREAVAPIPTNDANGSSGGLKGKFLSFLNGSK